MHNVTSPNVPDTTSDSAIERAIVAAGKTAPRVTPSALQAVIASEHYFTAADGVLGEEINRDDPTTVADPALELLTICVLVLKNGYTVLGKSACASPENFDVRIGRNIARQNAEQEIWPLLGYQLKTALASKV